MASEIQSVARTFAVVEYLAAHSQPLLLSEISEACALPQATTHRLLANLCALGYVVNTERGRYRLSLKLFEISSACATRTSLIAIARPHLERLSEETNESVHLVVRDGADVIYVYKITRSIGSIQMASRIGMRLPMYRCAVGKSILATLPNQEIRAVFDASEVVAATSNTITNFDALLRNIEDVRRLGYAVDDEENEVGVKCVAVSLGRPGGEVSYACSISSLKQRMTEEYTHNLVAIMAKTKEAIVRELVLG